LVTSVRVSGARKYAMSRLLVESIAIKASSLPTFVASRAAAVDLFAFSRRDILPKASKRRLTPRRDYRALRLNRGKPRVPP
jgi:hypothetical protein